MSFVSILYRLIIYPLELLFEVIFRLSEKSVHNPGVSIIVLSLVVNFLVLPLYRRADAMQEEERDISAKMAPWLTHIRKTFKGDERFMMQQTYYRQMGYKQVYVLRSSIPLLLQIPFFIAAYHFLSHLNYLSGVSLGPIKDLAEPDKLIKLGGGAINFLPILMTVINITAGAIYSKGFPIKTKIQMYGIAAIFLVLLYDSPAGLVFYWTLNNVFSLMKNIVAAFDKKSIERRDSSETKGSKLDDVVFFVATTTLALLTGLFIPLRTVASAPQDFVSLTHYVNPLRFVALSALTGAGVFIIWFGVFYLLAKSKARTKAAMIVVMMDVVAIIDCFTLVLEKEDLSITLTYQEIYHVPILMATINIIVVAIVCFLIYRLWKYRSRVVIYILIIPLIALAVMSAGYYRTASSQLSDEYYLGDRYAVPAEFTLSTEGDNVIVIMLDRAMGYYLPFILDNDEELKNSYDGFTYYSNVLSYGPNTLFGAPALYGGPDYSAENINLRSDETMESKINESLLVMPLLFKNEGYDVTVTDPPYAGYNWIPDISIYDEYGIDAYYTKGAFSCSNDTYMENEDAILARQERNFFCFGLTKSVPALFVDLFYDDGDYNAVEYSDGSVDVGSPSFKRFVDAFAVLQNLSSMTYISSDDSDHFIMFTNETTHEATLITGDSYDEGIVSGDRTLYLNGNDQIAHYETDRAALVALGRWFDYLRENGVYDNTRIIIVADHGKALTQDERLLIDSDLDIMAYYPLLMVKDFDDTGFSVCSDFVTNAVVPELATRGIIGEQVNPFTGNSLIYDYEANPPAVIISHYTNPQENPGYRFNSGIWCRLYGNDVFNLQAERIPEP